MIRADDTFVAPETTIADTPALTGTLARPAARKTLEFARLSMDTRTGSVRWRGQVVDLNANERSVLRVLLEHAGQIVHEAKIARTTGLTERQLESNIATLCTTLESTGIHIKPRRIGGIGYILWH